MTIEYHPPSLKFMLTAAYSERRLKNKDGFATFKDVQGKETAKPIGGSILEICRAAAKYDTQYPEHVVNIFENNCGMSGIPNPLP